MKDWEEGHLGGVLLFCVRVHRARLRGGKGGPEGSSPTCVGEAWAGPVLGAGGGALQERRGWDWD